MKIKIIFLLFIWTLFIHPSYSQGILFESINIEEACSKAKKEEKLIFVDVYTVW